jgi:predicted transposase/invertase (TIGR01784 family)
MEQEPLRPTNDFVFKKVFTENELALRDFLMAVLDLPVEEYQKLEVLDPNLLPERIEDKRCILDIKLHTASGKAVDIEIQVEYQEFLWKRIQYYCAKMLAEQGHRGDEYDNLPGVISILITNFSFVQYPGYHSRFRLYDEKNGLNFPDSMELNILEIPKIHKKPHQNDASPLGDWMRFFAAQKKEEFEMLAQSNPAIAEAWSVIKRLSADDSARMIAESRDKALRDFNSMKTEAHRKGKLEGLQEGERKGKLEVARNLLQEKLPVELVVKSTGLTLAEVKQLASGLTD